MKIYILRHGTAEPRGPGIQEAERKLTTEGKRELKTVLRVVREAGAAPELILTSPWKRALDTARMASEALNCAELKETRALLPEVPPAQIWREIRAHPAAKEIMMVGHEPQLSRIAGFLLNTELALDLKKGGIMRIDTDVNDTQPKGVLKWMLSPRLAGAK